MTDAMPERLDLIAVNVLDRSLQDAENLLNIHAALSTDRGRRVEELSLNRAAVVLTVAAWQAFVERLVEVLLLMLEPKSEWYGDEPHKLLAATTDFHRLRAQVNHERRRFSTPNSDGTRNLLKALGYDPFPHWNFRAGTTDYAPHDAAETLGHWIRVRNHVAHGNPELPEVPVISRTARRGIPTIHKADAERCITFVRALGKATEIGAASTLYLPDVAAQLVIESLFPPEARLFGEG